MNYTFRKATIQDIPQIWQILQDAIARRKDDGSNQWQDGYPNPETIENDITIEAGYILEIDSQIAGYAAILINDEPEYDNLKGKWLTTGDFVVFHRLAVAKEFLGKGMASELFLQIEKFAKDHNINSIKADTNFDNLAMLHLFENLGYHFCGEVYFRGSARKAYEKVL
ncbi:GNAT family N-acetyltransferase [Aequorivita sp. H23M31]|uniref:GNAT family N-acetyltransferase n=1 Tax=Aequorivita ciconiae TaxID=2494375 RepID=A0A410G339_9FLAO|nr:GNAT family N-acetyltransferase [Aequorivita sp. H23M31]QAA81692.1 GNAT family N-acetyltransferase [Aequorivita sp. H23M31]